MITSTRIVVYTFLNYFIGGIRIKCKGKYQLVSGMHIKLAVNISLRFPNSSLRVYGVSKQMPFLVLLYLVISEKVLK